MHMTTSSSSSSSVPAYVKDVMSKDIIKIGADSSVLDVANTMVEKNISSVLLEDTGKIIGILTERDLVKNVCAKDMLASKTPAVSIMSAPVAAAVNRDAPIERA